MTARSAQPDLCAPYTLALPVDRAAISTLGVPFSVETISASDGLAARLSEVQIDVGEGPGWDAHSSQVTVLVPTIDESSRERWPMFSRAISALAVEGMYSFPLSVGTLRIGSLDLYADSTSFTPAVVAKATDLAASTSVDLLRYALDHRNDDASGDGPYSRREVLQATGMVIAQMRVPADDALLLIRAHAFATGRPVRDVAADITARRITFEP